MSLPLRLLTLEQHFVMALRVKRILHAASYEADKWYDCAIRDEEYNPPLFSRDCPLFPLDTERRRSVR